MPTKTSDICDALDAAEACATQFRSFGRRTAFSGAIRTLRCFEDIADLRIRVKEHGDGCVLVVDGGGSLNRAIFGDNMAASLLRNGWAGVIVHGAVRDVAELDAMDFGVKALGTVAKRGERNGGGAADVPVTFGGVTFVPGRHVLADEDGVVVLPEGVTAADGDLAPPDKRKGHLLK
jgi:regulator of ribonuclease activity A